MTLLDVPRDVLEDTVRGVMAKFGRIEEVMRHHLIKEGMEHSEQSISENDERKKI